MKKKDKKTILKIGMVFVVITLFFGAGATSAIETGNLTLNTSPNNLLESKVDKQVGTIDQSYADMLLASPMKIDINKMTMGELKQLCYKDLTKAGLSGNIKLFFKIFLKIRNIFKTLDEIGVTSIMTIAEAKNIIDKNTERVTVASGDEGLQTNFCCFIRGFGSCTGEMRCQNLFPSIVFNLGIKMYTDCPENSYISISGLFGFGRKQYYSKCDGTKYGGPCYLFRGDAYCPIVGKTYPFEISGFAWITETNVPFV
jgi:hypothetical protein